MAAKREHSSVWKQTEKRTKRPAAKPKIDVRDKEVIVWDGEGMKLSGADKPQHYVLFGCSARPDAPLVIDAPSGRLEFQQLADYCMDVVAEHPNAVHLGYFFKYDQNMIIWSLPWPTKWALYTKGSCLVKRGAVKYYVRLILGKSIRITRVDARGQKLSILIEDFAPFFQCSFVKAYEGLFKEPGPEWATVKQGKADRSVMLYADMPRVRRYWRAEIIALLELAIEFRDIMFRADFLLTQWHGPGALADYARRKFGLVEHEWGGKEENLPNQAVHEAIKSGYYGGHFEPYVIGRIEGPIHSYDKNSAYPSAFCEIPTMAKGGWWENIGPVSAERWHRNKSLRTGFAVYKVRWVGRTTAPIPIGNRAIQPFPHRNKHGLISYPQRTVGWYWSPEVKVAMEWARQDSAVQCEILDGWIWHPVKADSWPWEDIFLDMYDRRLTLKRNNNAMQLAFKLFLNSMYGKMAQRAGGVEKPPASHTLCIAGYVTSACRASVMWLMKHCPPDDVISVETDGVFTRTAPEDLRCELPISEKLGDWTHKVYDEMLLLQNGVYMLRKGDKWEPPKTRGFSVTRFLDANGEPDPRVIDEYLARCVVGEKWPALELEAGEAFLGLGTACARATVTLKVGPRAGKRNVVPFKAAELHCRWVPEVQTLDVEGRKGKRIHSAQWCRACQRGESPATRSHDLVIHSITDMDPREMESSTYVLPWEKGKEESWRLGKEKLADAVTV